MKKHLFALSSLCLVLTACESSNHSGSAPRDNQTNPSAYSATDTGRNVRDRNDQTLTSGNQGENEVDLTITQKIRQAIVDDASLSTNAKNIKIITLNGVTTLRGPVNNDREKLEIAKKARSVNGVKNVDNQLEIIRNDNDSNSLNNGSVNGGFNERNASNRYN